MNKANLFTPRIILVSITIFLVFFFVETINIHNVEIGSITYNFYKKKKEENS